MKRPKWLSAVIDSFLGRDIERAYAAIGRRRARAEGECVIHIKTDAPLISGEPAIVCLSCLRRGAEVFGPGEKMTPQSAKRLREIVSLDAANAEIRETYAKMPWVET